MHNCFMQLLLGDCVEVMRGLGDNSVDSVVCDPPYELGFMGKHWDNTGIAYNVDMWREVLRVLKPGGYLLSFGGSRTYHRMACAIEDAGFEIRDMIEWMYGSGFPKSLDVSKAIDKAAGAERKRTVNPRWAEKYPNGPGGNHSGGDRAATVRQLKSISGNPLEMTLPATDSARQWSGWGTALKPAHEPICMARKPLSEKTVAENVLKWGTGGINIDGCRVGTEQTITQAKIGMHGCGSTKKMQDHGFRPYKIDNRNQPEKLNLPGRFPANLIHDGSDEVMEMFPNTGNGNGSGPYNYAGKEYNNKDTSMFNGDKPQAPSNFNDSGSAARFFYSAKASKQDRDEGCEGLEEKTPMEMTGRRDGSEGLLRVREDGTIGENAYAGKSANAKNHHPTVKPTNLMRYLCKLVTPPNGIVLDPFMGSGSTGKAAKLEGFDFIGIEMNEEYLNIAKARIESVKTQKQLFE